MPEDKMRVQTNWAAGLNGLKLDASLAVEWNAIEWN